MGISTTPNLKQAFLTPKAITASRVLTGSDSETAWCNTNASGSITITLPKAAPGLRYDFLVSSANSITLQPKAVDSFRGNTVGTAITLTTVGQYVRVVCIQQPASSTAGSFWELQNDAVSLVYEQTAAEIAAGVTVVNWQYPPGVVDRYGTNTMPGTTSMVTAFQASVNQARHNGVDVVYGYTNPYLLDSPVDCTQSIVGSQNSPGLTIRQLGAPYFNTSPVVGGILVKHNSYTTFDFTGQSAFKVYDMSLVTDATTYPQTCFLLARNSTKSSVNPGFYNTNIFGKFSTSLLYNYAAEGGEYLGNYWNNLATDAGAKLVAITAYNNVLNGNAGGGLGFVSNFTTIATGSISTTDHKFVGGQYLLSAASTTSDLIYLDFANHFKMSEAFWFMNAGRAVICADLVNGLTGHNKIVNSHGDAGANSQYGLYFLNSGTKQPSDWVLDNIFWSISTASVAADTSSCIVDNLKVKALHEQATKGIILTGTLQNSNIDYAGTISLNNSAHNFIIGTFANVTITGTNTGFLFDMTAAQLYINGVPVGSGSGGSTVTTITQAGGASQTWTKGTGNFVQVVCIGGGGGGASGAKEAATAGGGGGGGAGGISIVTLRASDLPGTVTVTFSNAATGGNGGAAQATNATSGNAGTGGSNVSFGNFVIALGGTAGNGGSSVGGGAGTGGQGIGTQGTNGGTGSTGNGNNGASPNQTTLTVTAYAPTGGGGGGGSSVGAVSGGGTGGAATLANQFYALAGGAGGTGNASGGSTGNSLGWLGSGGGGGGSGNGVNGGFSGGTGGNFGGGGGGGGSCENTGTASGAGGNGGPAACIITQW